MEVEKRATEFVVFCIENTAEALGVSGDAVYRALAASDGISGFLYPSLSCLAYSGKGVYR